MADNLTDAQKVMRDAIGSHRYDISDYHVHRCICGEDIGRADDALDAHRSVAVDEALGGLVLEYASGQIVPGEAEYTITDGSRGPSRKDAEKCLYFPRFDLIARWVSGWTPEEDS